MKKIILSLLLIFSFICNCNQITFANEAVKEESLKQTYMKPSYFIQLRSWQGGVLNIDMSVIIASETKRSYDTGIYYCNPQLKNVNIFKDMFGNVYVSQEFSSQEEAERELIKITKEYNEILASFYKGEN